MLCRDLRDRGVSVTPSESIDAARTLGHVDLGDREDVRLALRTVLVSRREDFEAFDAAFDAAWRLPGGMAAPIPMPHLRADVRRAPNQQPKKNAPNVHMDPEALTALKGKGDGYFRDRTSPRARRIQVRPLKPDA